MNEEKKIIEEMAKAISPYYDFCKITECENCNRKKLSKCRYYSFAKRCVMNGYRRQSDTVREILQYLYEKMGNVSLSDTELVLYLAAQYGVEVEE